MSYNKLPYDINDVVSELGLVQRSSAINGYYVDCPFCGDDRHRGKMKIFNADNRYKCFRCGVHGNMIDLYREVKGSPCDTFKDINSILSAAVGFSSKSSIPKKKKMKNQEVLPVQNAAKRNNVYSYMLSLLSLTEAHRKHLKEERGLSDEAIENNGYRSIPFMKNRKIAKTLVDEGFDLTGIPGFYTDDNGNWTANFFKNPGILIPVKSIDGYILGFQVRFDKPGKGLEKYMWLSSIKHKNGSSPGSPIHFIGDPTAKNVIITEGILKANIVNALSNATVIAVPGTAISGVKDYLKKMKSFGLETVWDGFDMDKEINTAIEETALRVLQTAHSLGLEIKRFTWTWNPETKENKGLDDLLLNQKKISNETLIA